MKAKSIKQEITLGNYAEFIHTQNSFTLIRERLHAIPVRGLKRKAK